MSCPDIIIYSIDYGFMELQMDKSKLLVIPNVPHYLIACLPQTV